MRASSSERRGSLLVAAGLALAGCAVVASTVDPARFRVGHDEHVKRGLECQDCHGGAKTGAKAGMPEPKYCLEECHDPKEDKAAVAAAVARWKGLAPEERYARGASYADVIFDHSKHVAKGLQCLACHEGAKDQAIATPGGPMPMEKCIACHEKRGVAKAGPDGGCAVCHAELRKDARPPSHLGDWTRRHGAISRMPRAEVKAERCDLCHRKQDCDACHVRDAPRDHTNTWRTATHGLSAAIDRSRCLVCHRADSCDRCHRDTPPAGTHRSTAFGAPRDMHCLSCHEPLGSSGCATCHKSTRSHSFATPKPATHTPAMNCRQCHGAGQPLPHVDNGSDCNACHR